MLSNLARTEKEMIENPAGNYLFKVSNGKTRKIWELQLNFTKKTPHDVVLGSILLTLNRFYSFVWYFHIWLLTSKCQQGRSNHCSQKFPGSRCTLNLSYIFLEVFWKVSQISQENTCVGVSFLLSFRPEGQGVFNRGAFLWN